MTTDKRVPAYSSVKVPRKKPRKIYFQNRRNKVAELHTQGQSVRKIADALGVSRSTVHRDIKWLEEHEHMLRAQQAAEEVIEGELMVIDEPIPTSIAEFRSLEQKAVISLLANKKTYQQIADELGVSLNTVVNHVNRHLAEYGDWGGRTMIEWRNEQLLQIDQQLVELQEDMNIQPIPRMADGGEDEAPGWDLSPYQAAVIRDKARKRYGELNIQKSRLLSLMVQRTEVDVNEKSVVVHVQGVDFDAWQQGRH